MVIRPLPTRCPACEGPLAVKALFCPACGTEVHGRFALNEFALLPKEHLDFLRLFVKTRGNLKEVERILGVSYPTVRARLDALLKALGYEEDEGKDRLEVLEALRRGEISVEEAVARLREGKS
ncbi:hypothetical protein TthAA37_16460 [Thermus thermophilus]|uniref:DUF2089 domain-containing protein n=1 Tax=Thermus thermophilus TaxID=274 RepID=A0A3P4AQR1_THETH|nr:DUF2089 domain-containing protein [Thermus thermophilus]NHK38920.1 DUF2089 domain-containing protein [Thermus thermophilus]VCU52393.1 hypothetical protein TTHN1_00140 [Thermus thermophilus]BBL82778.1 hypothetical protein TthAA220_15620 [Thermus thermophilus]BBL85077.1 hypothetical protein TthAA229_15580 [Thermus thermophilus]BCZ87441.1 hypothetical protein TthAA11_16230 [Thermus thermophilus]